MLEAQLFQMTNWGAELEQVSKRLQHHAPALHVRQSLQAQVPASSLQALHQVLHGLDGECPHDCSRRIVQNDAAVEVSGAPSCSGGSQHDRLLQAAGLLTVEQSLKLGRRVHPRRLQFLEHIPHVERPGEHTRAHTSNTDDTTASTTTTTNTTSSSSNTTSTSTSTTTSSRLWASRKSKASQLPKLAFQIFQDT